MTSETGSRRPAELRAPSPSASAPREDDPPWRRQAIPRLRSGSYLPSFLEPRSRSEQALVAVVQEAYVNGVSTRKVDRLVTQLGLTGISRSRVSRLCSGLDEQVRLCRERPLEGAYPYLSLDAKVEKVREAGGVRSSALVVAYGVHESGRREVIGIDVGESETEASGGSYCAACGRAAWGVALCVSDAHQGLKAAVGKVLGCTWQRCTVHFLREMLGHVSRAQQPIMATAIRRIFAAESSTEASECLGGVVAALRGPPPKVARLLEEAAEELLAFMSFRSSTEDSGLKGAIETLTQSARRPLHPRLAAHRGRQQRGSHDRLLSVDGGGLPLAHGDAQPPCNPLVWEDRLETT